MNQRAVLSITIVSRLEYRIDRWGHDWLLALVRLSGARIMGFAKARETARNFCDVLLNLQVELFWLGCLTVVLFV